MTKQELRTYMRQEKSRYTPEQRAAFSAQVVERLEQHPLFRAAATVLLYRSLPDEVDTHALIRRVAANKRILLPVVKDETHLSLRLYAGEEHLARGAFGIEEPVGDDESASAQLDLAVVPGVAFDAEGHRLGRGRGYYDRLLVGLRRLGVPLLGLCFPFQRVASVPTDEHDVAMDDVVS